MNKEIKLSQPPFFMKREQIWMAMMSKTIKFSFEMFFRNEYILEAEMRQSSSEDDTTKPEILTFLLSKLSESKIDIKCVIKRSGSSFKTAISELFVGYSPDKPLTVPGIPTSPPRAWGEWMGYVKDMYPGAEFECIGIDAFSIAFFPFSERLLFPENCFIVHCQLLRTRILRSTFCLSI